MSQNKLWYLYDFANSFASAIVIFYFPLILLEAGFKDFWVGVASACSTLLLILLYPHLGRRADVVLSRRMKYIRFSSGVMIAALLTLGFLNLDQSSHGSLLTLLLLYSMFQIAFQGSYVFYSSQLGEMTELSSCKNKLSSIGLGLGQLGNAIAIGVAGFLLAKNISFFHVEGKQVLFLFGAVTFTLLALPYLLSNRWSTQTLLGTDKFSFKEMKDALLGNKKVLFFLVGYMLIADSIFTLQIYLSLYFKNVFGLADKYISILGAVSLFALFLTCMAIGFFSSRIKRVEKFLIVAACMYIISFSNLSVAPASYSYLLCSLVFAGTAYGLFFPLARSYYSEIIPQNSQAEYFSFFVIFERAAVVIGPLLFVGVLFLLDSVEVEIRYRLGVFLLAVISALGLFFLQKGLWRSVKE